MTTMMKGSNYDYSSFDDIASLFPTVVATSRYYYYYSCDQ